MCFSSADREPYVHALFYQLKTLGINVWYDYDNLRLGDNRCEKNLVLPFQNIQVAIIVISHNLFRSACAIEEFQKIKETYFQGNLTVIPIFYSFNPRKLAKKDAWVKNLIYHEVASSTEDVLELAKKILATLLHLEVNCVDQETIGGLIQALDSKQMITKHGQKLVTVLQSYQAISKNNVNARVAVLYTLCCLTSSGSRSPLGLIRISDLSRHLFQKTQLNIPINTYEVDIFEMLTLLLIQGK